MNCVSGYLLNWQYVPPAVLHSCIKNLNSVQAKFKKHVDMVERQRMRAEFWIGKRFVNALLDDHGSDGRALR
jgi:hypothetical protein